MRPRGFSSHPLIGFALTLGLLLGGAGHGSLWAGEPKAVLESPAGTRFVGNSIFLDGSKSVSERPLRWRMISSPTGAKITNSYDDKGRNVYGYVPYAPPGQYSFLLIAFGATADGKDLIDDEMTIAITLDGFIPQPTPVPPQPIPTPTPVPPGPTPTPTPVPPAPTPAPIPATGLHVLMVYDSLGLSKMPVPQVSVLYAKAIRDYLNAKCPAGQDGKTKEWRIWDAKVDASADEKLWQDALARPRASVPWIVISDPAVGGYEGPLPATVDDTLALLKKYGGN